jgi:hypothetical protein
MLRRLSLELILQLQRNLQKVYSWHVQERELRKAVLDFLVIVSSLGSDHRNQIADDLRRRFLS